MRTHHRIVFSLVCVILSAKTSGAESAPEPERASNVVDFMALLKKSLAANKRSPPAHSKAAATAGRSRPGARRRPADKRRRAG